MYHHADDICPGKGYYCEVLKCENFSAWNLHSSAWRHAQGFEDAIRDPADSSNPNHDAMARQSACTDPED